MSILSDLWNRNLGGGNWLARFGLQNEEFNFTKSWGGGAWMDPGKRNFLGLDEKGNIPWTNVNLFKVDQGGGGGEEGGGGGDGEADTSEDAEKLARGFDLGSEQSEKDRLARMRRMLAGRYGRAETNLTGGTGFGAGSQRTLGGFS